MIFFYTEMDSAAALRRFKITYRWVEQYRTAKRVHVKGSVVELDDTVFFMSLHSDRNALVVRHLISQRRNKGEQSELLHHQFVLRSSLPSVRCTRFLLNYSFLFRPIPLSFFRGKYRPSN